jgi:SAM-dependent methyltransferase
VATIDELDLSVSPVPACDAVLIFDVLHLLSRDAQDRLLANVAQALLPGGLLIVREADAAAGWKFHMVRLGNRLNALRQGRFSRKFCFDTLAGWTARIEALGFDVEAVTRHDSGVFGNFLIQVRRSG